MNAIIISSLLIAGISASVLPIESSSSVQVKSNGNEYSYTIKENKGIIPIETVPIIPILNAEPNDLKRDKEADLQRDKEELKRDKEGESKQKIDDKIPNQKIDYESNKFDLNQIYIPGFYPGYRLIPNADYQLIDYPYYYPYYAYHYPYIRLI